MRLIDSSEQAATTIIEAGENFNRAAVSVPIAAISLGKLHRRAVAFRADVPFRNREYRFIMLTKYRL